MPSSSGRSLIPTRFTQRRSETYRGWWVVGAVTLVAFSQVAFFNPVLGVFIGPLQEDFGWSRTEIGVALSIGTLCGAVLAPLIGSRIDRHGARAFLTVAVLLIGICLLLLSAVQEIWQFYVLFSIGRAVVIGLTNLAITVVIANWFIRNRGRATGVTLVGVRGAGVLMPLIVLLFLSLADWRAAFLALGVLVLVLGVVPPWLFVRRCPEDLGLRPDGDPAPLPPADGGAVPDSADADPRWSVRQAVHTRAFWLLLFGTSQIFLVGGAVNLSIVPHLQDNGLGQTTAITVITVWAAMGVVGGIFGGELRQRLPVRAALPASMVVIAIAIGWLVLIENAWMAYLFAIWHGLAFGAMLPLTQVIFPDYFGRWSVGAIRGAMAPVQFGFNAAGPVLAGVVFDSRGSYDLAFLAFVGAYLLAAVLIAFAKPPRHPGAPPPPATRTPR